MHCSSLSGCPAVFPCTDASPKLHSCHQMPLIFQQLTARQRYLFEDDNYWFGNFLLVWDFSSERSTDFSEATPAEELSSLTAEEQKEGEGSIVRAQRLLWVVGLPMNGWMELSQWPGATSWAVDGLRQGLWRSSIILATEQRRRGCELQT